MITESSCGNYHFLSLVTAYLLKAIRPFPRLLLHSRAIVRDTVTASHVSLLGKYQGKKPLAGDGDKQLGNYNVFNCYSYIHLIY